MGKIMVDPGVWTVQNNYALNILISSVTFVLTVLLKTNLYIQIKKKSCPFASEEVTAIRETGLNTKVERRQKH